MNIGYINTDFSGVPISANSSQHNPEHIEQSLK